MKLIKSVFVINRFTSPVKAAYLPKKSIFIFNKQGMLVIKDFIKNKYSNQIVEKKESE